MPGASPESLANAAHLEECGIDGCERCEHLLEYFMACDRCGHFGHIESDGWFRGRQAGNGGAMVYCSETCRGTDRPDDE